MECRLHQQLKARYGSDRGGRNEVAVAGFRIDAVEPSGRLVEVQTRDLGPLRPKLRRLLPDHAVLVVKPWPVRRRVRWQDRAGRPLRDERRSPWRGELLDAFESLIGLAGVFPHPNLAVDLLAVEVVEVRVARRRRPGFAVVDRELHAVDATVSLARADDLWRLIPDGWADGPFTTRELADHLGRSLPFCQKVAYSLFHAGAVEVVGKRGAHREYVRVASTLPLTKAVSASAGH